jgi:cell division septation protein DedD
LAWLLPGLLSSLVASCAEPAGATRIVGPDGTAMLHVHCADEQVACFQIAGQMCPSGYYLSPIFDPHDGNFLVRCKDATQAAVVASAQTAATPAPPAVQARAPEPGWPPTEVAKPSEPWPAPSAGSPPPPKTAIGDVDLGY